MRQWYALRSKPRKEVSAATLLGREAIDVYVPQVSVRKRRGGQPELVPFFPNYLFARLDPMLGEINLVRYTHGVLYVVSFGDEPCPVPDELIMMIKERLARSGEQGYAPSFGHGDRVLVTEGPLRDTEAIFDRELSASGRVQVLVQILQRLCRVDLQVGQIRLLGKAAGLTRA